MDKLYPFTGSCEMHTNIEFVERVALSRAVYIRNGTKPIPYKSPSAIGYDKLHSDFQILPILEEAREFRFLPVKLQSIRNILIRRFILM